MFQRKNIPLLLGFAIPICMILFVAASIYIPGMFTRPRYNFLYSNDDYYYSSVTYYVENGRLLEKIQPSNPYADSKVATPPQLYVYDVVADKSIPVSYQEAQTLTLDSRETSPDGFKLENGTRNSGIFPFFWYSGSENNEKYLVGNNASKKLTTRDNSYYSMRFLGWIIK